MDVSSITSSHASQIVALRQQSSPDEAGRINRDTNRPQQTVADNTGATDQSAPTVNTSGQTVGQIINVTA